uniref:Uncharacterized protein n=1 Tax=Lepeophtheirus salmonis TaxID=72036 RepID=A0A0K2VI10_LEPSM
MEGVEIKENKKKEERSSSLTSCSLITEDLAPKLLNKLKEESLHSTSPKEALMSAISASFQDLSQLEDNVDDEEGPGLAPELVVEVNSVLSKLMNSLNENLDPELIPTIKDLQATLNSKKKRIELESRFRRQCPPQDTPSSKVPWKIRAARKRAIKHHTTGMTKDEFQLIKNSLQESAKSFTSIPTQSYALSRNKSESAIRSHRNVISENLSNIHPEPFHKDISSVISKDGKPITLPLIANGPELKPSDLGYASDVCDYNISSSSASEKVSKSTPTSKADGKTEASTLQTKEPISKNSEKPPRRNTKSTSGSAIKARIDRRKRMRHANAIDNPHGSLSDQESSMIEDNDEDDEEEELLHLDDHDKTEPNINEELTSDDYVNHESYHYKSNGDSSDQKNQLSNSTNYNSSSSELTPETHRRKNWNSRFSNIKNAFASEEEIFYKSRSPSINRDNNNNAIPPQGGKKPEDKYMKIVVQARLENNKSRRNLSRSNSKNNGSSSSSGHNTVHTSNNGLNNNHSENNENKISSSKSKQPTPNRDPQPKSPSRISKSLPKESRAEAMGLEPTNKNRNDMDYQEYMNIISRVRRTKESTRVRTEQFRLASMYAQEKRRQEEIKREEERLKLEREKVQKDLERQKLQEQSLESQKVKESRSPSLVTPVQKMTTATRPSDINLDASNVLTPIKSSDNSSDASPILVSSTPINPSDKVVSDQTATITRLEEQARLERMRQEQKRQQELREEQVKAEQEKLERLRQEQIRQEKEREEIHRLEYERLKQIQEEQRKLDEERRRQQERIRLEQVRLEEERKRQETLQAERNAEYNRQRLDMEAQNVYLPQETRAKLLMSPTASSAPPISIASSTSNNLSNFDDLSPEEKIIQKRLSDQESLRKSHRAEESKIRQEKLKLIQQEEMLISRQEEMLRQVEAERQNLLKQEQLIRSRQQGRLTQVRQEKMLLEKQEEMLQMRERQLIEERIRQEKLRMEQKSLREQEEVIRKRQEQISKELMGNMSICDSSETRPFDPSQSLVVYSTSQSNDSNIQMEGDEDEDTLDEDSEEEEFYESTVEVMQKSTTVPTSVRTVGLANTDHKPWAHITPYLSTYENSRSGNMNQTPPSEMFMDEKTYVKSGVITSPESLRTSSTLITTPDESSLQLSLDGSCISTPPLVPPLPLDDVFIPVQPEIPPRVSSYDIVASSVSDIILQESSPRRNLIDTNANVVHTKATNNYKLSPKIGGPGSAFKPYSSSENLHDPSLFSPIVCNASYESNTNLLLPPTYPSGGMMITKKHPVVYNKVKELRKPIRAPFSTTDTEPEMKECHFPPEKNKRTVIKQHPYKPSYSTSETEDESYLARKTKWSRHHYHQHQQHKHSGSWDPLQVDSPPQITQKPVGIIQKPKPQHQFNPSTITLGAVEAPIPPAALLESFYPPVVIERGAQVQNETIAHFANLLSTNSKNPNEQVEIKPDDPFSLISLPRGTTHCPQDAISSTQSNQIRNTYNDNPNHRFLQQQHLQSKLNININNNIDNNSIIHDQKHYHQPSKPTIDSSHPSIWSQIPMGGTNSTIQTEDNYPNVVIHQSGPPPPPHHQQPSHVEEEKDTISSKTDNNPYQKHGQTLIPMNKIPSVISTVSITESSKENNGPMMFEPSKVLRQSSFSNLPIRNSTNENVPRQASFNCVSTFERRGEERSLADAFLSDIPIKGSSASQPDKKQDSATVMNNNASLKKTTHLQKELEQKLEQRKISKEELLHKTSKDEGNNSALVPLTVVEISSQGQKNRTKEEEASIFSDHDNRKKKALHHRLVNEAVSFKKDYEVKKKSAPRNNPTITAMEIMTRKEIRTCELEERLFREKYGKVNDSSESLRTTTFQNVNSSNKPVVTPKTSGAHNYNSTNSSKPPHQTPPKIILKKEPKRLDPEEIKARKSSTEKMPSPTAHMEQKKEARVISASNVITRSNNGVVEKKKEEYIENLSKSSSVEDMEDSRAAIIKREKVKKAAERFEKTASPVLGPSASPGCDKLPWNDENTPSLGKPKPGILRRRETFRKNGYALRMSKSSDSITASKMMSKNASGLRINQFNNPDSESPSDVYHKTRDEIRKILTIAKQSSVTERIKIFNNQIMRDVRVMDDRDRKAEAIKKEIFEAKLSAIEDNDENDVPLDMRRKSLQIPNKNPSSECRLRINQPPGSDASRQKIGRKLSEPALNGSVKSRIENYIGRKSANKKEPKLIMNSQSHQIYTQSATDYSATEEEAEFRGNNGHSMDYLEVPNSSYNKKHRGLRRSKSFATSGQYECVLSDEEVDEKTRQMMAFFNTSSSFSQEQVQPVSSNNSSSNSSSTPLKGVLKTKQQSISEEILGDDDLGNVDDIFERLLVENAVGDDGGDLAHSPRISSIRTSKLKNTTQSSCSNSKNNVVFEEGGTTRNRRGSKSGPLCDSLPPTNHVISSGKKHHHTHHQHHSSSSRLQAVGVGRHEYQSSSPTQSEYESCDPWEDY